MSSLRYAPVKQTGLRPRLVRIVGRVRWRVFSLAGAGGAEGSPVTLGRGSSVRLGGQSRLLMGAGVVIDTRAALRVDGVLEVAGPAYFGPGLHLVCFHRVTIGTHFRCGERVSIHDENHVVEPLSDRVGRNTEYNVSEVTIGDRVWVGANVVILPGVVIGDDTVVAAGSVVVSNLPPGVLAAGSPAVVKRTLVP